MFDETVKMLRRGRLRPSRLVCVECSTLSDAKARDWLTYLTVEGTLVHYCGPCGQAELEDDA